MLCHVMLCYIMLYSFLRYIIHVCPRRRPAGHRCLTFRLGRRRATTTTTTTNHDNHNTIVNTNSDRACDLQANQQGQPLSVR